MLSALRRGWNQHGNNGALHGLAVAAGQPVVSYVGYSLEEPWGEPRVVIGIDADGAEYLAEFLDRDECVQRGQAPLQQAQLHQVPHRAGPLQSVPLRQLASWPPGMPSATDQPPTSA